MKLLGLTLVEWGSVIAIIVSGGTLYVSLRKLRLEGKDTVIVNFTRITEDQRKEIDRVIKRNAELEASLILQDQQHDAKIIELRDSCTDQIAQLQKLHSTQIRELQDELVAQKDTIGRQMGRIRQLEKQLGIPGNGNGNGGFSS